MDKHWQGALDEAVSLEYGVFQLFELGHVRLQCLNPLLVVFEFFKTSLDSRQFLVVNLEVLQDLAELGAHLFMNVLSHFLHQKHFLLHVCWHFIKPVSEVGDLNVHQRLLVVREFHELVVRLFLHLLEGFALFLHELCQSLYPCQLSDRV